MAEKEKIKFVRDLDFLNVEKNDTFKVYYDYDEK